MKSRITALLAALMAAIGFVMFTPGVASATQAGQQTIYNMPNSQSGFSVQFNCGTYGVSPTYEYGENRSGPPCGANPPSGDREPVRFLVGSRWCAARHLVSGTTSYRTEYINAGATGVWIQAWQSWASGNYITEVATFPAGTYAPDGSGYFCGGVQTGSSSAGAYYEN